MGQQFSPLLGNNPSGPPPGESPIPVYVSVVLNKLLSVDAINYRFDVRMDVALSWYDSRLDSLWKGAEITLATQQAMNNQSSMNCLELGTPLVDSGPNFSNLSSQVLTSLSNSCQPSTISPFSSGKGTFCQRPCAFGSSSLCCDSVWLPDIIFENVVILSQDRPVSEIIRPLFAPPNSNSSAATVRVVKVQAQFTTQMNFVKFPFDSQNLKVTFGTSAPSGGDFYLVSSGVVRDRSSTFSSQNVSRTDELPVWAVDKVDLKCTRVNGGGLASRDFREQSQNPMDPTARFDMMETSSSSCDLVIHIYRQSQYYVWNSLFPMYCSVHLCFLVFFVSPANLELRMASVITLFLALTALQFTTNDELPTSSYVTAFHKILIVSYVLIGACGVESIFVHYAVTKKEKMNLMGRAPSGQITQHSQSNDDFSRSIQKQLDDERGDEEAEELEGFEFTQSSSRADTEVNPSKAADIDGACVKQSRRMKAFMLSKRVAVGSVTTFTEVHNRLANDSAFGYRLAFIMDSICLVSFTFIFWLMTYFILLVHKRH